MEILSHKRTPNGFPDLQKKYHAEREKRLRPDGINQYIDLPAHIANPMHGANKDYPIQNADLHNKHHRILIIGAGDGGLLFAVRLLQTTWPITP